MKSTADWIYATRSLTRIPSNGIIIVRKKAYNYEPEEYSHDLDTTDINLNGDEDGDEWDDYHGYYCEETRLCYRNGAQIHVDTENLNDFVWIKSIYEYHHDDDCTTCDECQEWILHRDALQSHLTGEKYCCGKCMEKSGEGIQAEELVLFRIRR